MSALVVIQNKRHGSTSTVTAEEWDAMQKKGHGLRVFRVLSETKIEPQPQPRKMNIVVPPEVQEIEAKKAEQRAAPVVAEVIEVASTTAPKKRGRPAKTGKATAAKGATENA